MLEQERYFKAWGLSKIALRNLILFFFSILLIAIAILSRVVVTLDQQKHEAVQQQIKCKEEMAQTIGGLLREQIQRLQQAMEKQDRIDEQLRKTRAAINKKLIK